ncbi:hypothetical protein ACIA8F_03565 [Streptomyces sp. NPDC051563]|uniref:hypothetical protein n=1 Tax=Streptomyces sp. NPDC051563 TaxID=3365659 RepID=UPI00379826C3
MRTSVPLVLRTSTVTAALAGSMLIPAAAGAAFAAPVTAAPQAAAAAAPAAATASDNSRYEGKAVYIGEGLVAVLRNEVEGPEAWIRSVGTGWKPGDNYMFRVVTMLDRSGPADKAEGLSLELTKAASAHPVLVVTAKDGSTKSYPLPAGQASTDCRVGPVGQPLGAGERAELYLTEKGPRVVLFHSGDGRGWTTLDRTTPSLPASAGIIARILNPSSATPVLEWKTQGGGTPFGRAAFPAFPKGCKTSYVFTKAAPTTPAKPQPKPQTVVVPKGPVAAGTEPGTEAGSGAPAPVAVAGVGVLSAAALLGAAFAVRARRARSRG